ncbi:MAG: cupin domain-containing protein [Myxococcaceae bacterium]
MTLGDGGKERLLDLARESRRMMVYADRLAAFFDLDASQAEAILDRAYDEKSWKPIVADGLSCFKVSPGGKWLRHECIMLRLKPNVRFPLHPHPFGEHILVLAGAFRDTNGQEVWRGEDAYNGAGSEHGLTALEGEDCIAAVITLKGPA